MIILVMGVTGAGKTTVGRELARQLGWRFADADDYHSAANIDKMHAGLPLTDEDRATWLRRQHDAISAWLKSSESVVLACSALKQSYRDMLLVSPDVKLVYLRATPALIAARLATRTGHYMNPLLVPSQFETLQEPAHSFTVDASENVQEIVRKIRAWFGS